jgi:hypothetical protein
VSYEYPDAGKHLVACRVRDAIPDSQDPDHRPVVETIKVVTQNPPPPPAAPSVDLSYAFDPYNPVEATFKAKVTGGVHRDPLPWYLISWDLNYDGMHFDTDASGNEVKLTLDELRVFTVACRVEDAIPSDLDPDNRPVLKTMQVIPLSPRVKLTYTPDPINPLLEHFHASVSFGVPMDPPPPYIIAWDFDYDGIFHADALGSDPLKLYGKLDYHKVACLVEDGVPDSLDPNHRPVIETIDVVPPPPSIELYYAVDENNALKVYFQAQITGGVPNDGPPFYTIEWDFDYVGDQFDTQASGPLVSFEYGSAGSYRIACRVGDSVPSQLDPQHRPVIRVLNISLK